MPPFTPLGIYSVLSVEPKRYKQRTSQKLGAPVPLGVTGPQLRLVWAMAIRRSDVFPDTIVQYVLAGRKKMPPSAAGICKFIRT